MRIAAQYSHLNGLEYMLVHHKELWREIQEVIASVDAEACKTKVSNEKTIRGKLLYSPVDMNDCVLCVLYSESESIVEVIFASTGRGCRASSVNRLAPLQRCPFAREAAAHQCRTQAYIL